MRLSAKAPLVNELTQPAFAQPPSARLAVSAVGIRTQWVWAAAQAQPCYLLGYTRCPVQSPGKRASVTIEVNDEVLPSSVGCELTGEC